MKKYLWYFVSIFFIVFGVSLFAINSKNLQDFSLHHMISEAIVERRIVNLGGSYASELQPNGDVLWYQGKVYGIKQPGTGFLGAMAYYPVSKFGIHYATNYLLASGWVSIVTSSFVLALIALIVFVFSYKLGAGMRLASLLGMGSVLCTNLLPYSGFPHHDTIALLFVLLATYLGIQGAASPTSKHRHDYFIWSGFFAGIVIFFSMLPVSLIITLALIIIFYSGWFSTAQFTLGLFLGLVPTLTYNYFALGGFLHFPNVMGASLDTIPHFSIMQMIPNLMRYVTQPGLSVILFSPLAVMGLYGWITSKNTNRVFRVMKSFVLLGTLIFLVHLASFETEGDLQFGPRYLIPILPLWFLGLQTYFSNKIVKFIITFLAPISFAINFLGALYGAMYKEIEIFPITRYYTYFISSTTLLYPFRTLGICMLIFGLFVYSLSFYSTGKKNC